MSGPDDQRKPLTVPARIAPLPNLPLFHKLDGRRVLVVGSSQGAAWKAELLAAAGADVRVLAEHAAGARLFDGLNKVVVEARRWTAADLEGAALAVADMPDKAEARSFVAAARAAGVPVNIIDGTELCDFQFGTIVNRAPMVVAISTDGGAPMLGQSIRARIEAVLPLGLSAWAKAAQQWRPQVKRALRRFDARRAFWKRFVERAWANADRAPNNRDLDELIGGIGTARRGRVTLVGAGPGDPELVTLKAVRALQLATVILYDDLVAPEILELARREALRIAVGKTGHGPSCSQQEINRQLVELARAGETVVRLKGGDPLIFGRATEEIEACETAGIAVDIIPGISSAQGAAAVLGISLTERRHARRVQFVTGHGADGTLPDDIDWTAIADSAATTAVYMPRKTLADFASRAIAAGIDPDTPALAIASATLATQAQARATMATIADAAEALPPRAPVIVIIGQVARERANAAPQELAA